MVNLNRKIPSFVETAKLCIRRIRSCLLRYTLLFHFLLNDSNVSLKRFNFRFLGNRARWIRTDMSGSCVVVRLVRWSCRTLTNAEQKKILGTGNKQTNKQKKCIFFCTRTWPFEWGKITYLSKETQRATCCYVFWRSWMRRRQLSSCLSCVHPDV